MFKKIIATAAMIVIIVIGGAAVLQLTKQTARTNDDKLLVTASYYPLYDFARQVGGDKVNVVTMTPAGAEPHDYEPSPQALIDAHNAKVFIYNGGPMEPWVDSFLSDYKNIAVNASQGITLEKTDEDDGHAHDVASDPHFWLDPVLAQQIVNTIRDGLSKADPANSSYYASRANSYNEKLAELDRSFADGLASCTLNTAISSHGAFSYLAHRYGFTVISIAGIEPEDEPSPAKMAELTNLVKQKGIKYIFFESLVSPRLAQTIALETGAETLVFDPIEGLSAEDQSKGRDYLSVQYDNLKNLRTALECR